MAMYKQKETRPAPSNTKGPIHWLKENLFSSVQSTILTLIALGFLLMIIPPFFQWAYIDATFAGETKEQCTNDGACWVFVKQKMDMFMYGFYPEMERWRLKLGLGLFIALMVSYRFIKSNKIKFALFNIFMISACILTIGGIFGLEHVPTDKWGGLMLSIVVAGVGIVFSFPIGIVVAFGRQSDLPIIKSVCVTYVEFIRGVPLITMLFM